MRCIYVDISEVSILASRSTKPSPSVAAEWGASFANLHPPISANAFVIPAERFSHRWKGVPSTCRRRHAWANGMDREPEVCREEKACS